MSPVQTTDLLLDSLGSALPVYPTDWEKLAVMLLGWRREIESEPMREWVAA